jgi:hypothetical protein
MDFSWFSIFLNFDKNTYLKFSINFEFHSIVFPLFLAGKIQILSAILKKNQPRGKSLKNS